VRLKLTPAFVQKPPQAIIAIHRDTVRAEKPDRKINEKPDRVVVWDTQERGFGLMVPVAAIRATLCSTDRVGTRVACT
jgi:hypothetical protein